MTIRRRADFVLLFTAAGVRAYRLPFDSATADAIATFDAPVAGTQPPDDAAWAAPLARFGHFVATCGSARFALLADLDDEAARMLTLPRVAARDLRHLAARRLEQAAGAAACRCAITAKGGRSDNGHRAVLCWIPERDALSRWLGVLSAQQAEVVSFASPLLLAGACARQTGVAKCAVLFATVTPAGLRQVLVTDGLAVFSRLTAATASGDESGSFAREIDRTVRYLAHERMVDPAWLPIEVRVALRGAPAVLPPALSDSDLAVYRTPTGRNLLDAHGASLSWVEATGCVVAAGDYRDRPLRRPHELARLRTTLRWGSMLAASMLVATALWQGVGAWSHARDARQALARRDRLAAETASLRAALPPLPARPEFLRGAAMMRDALGRRDTDWRTLVERAAAALDGAPDIAIDAMEFAGPDLSGAARHSLTLTGRIVGVAAGSQSRANARALELLRHFRGHDDLSAQMVRLPFDARASSTLSGESRDGRSAPEPEFVLRVSREDPA